MPSFSVVGIPVSEYEHLAEASRPERFHRTSTRPDPADSLLSSPHGNPCRLANEHTPRSKGDETQFHDCTHLFKRCHDQPQNSPSRGDMLPSVSDLRIHWTEHLLRRPCPNMFGEIRNGRITLTIGVFLPDSPVNSLQTTNSMYVNLGKSRNLRGVMSGSVPTDCLPGVWVITHRARLQRAYKSVC